MKKILLLEDNATDADLVIREIKDHWPNIEILSVSLVEEARKIVQSDFEIDIALFDVKLPDGNGMDLLSDLREQKCKLPIVIQTISGSEEMAVAALKSGANDFVTKKPGFQKQIPKLIEFTLQHFQESQKHLSVLYVEHHQNDIDLTKRYFKKNAAHINFKMVSSSEEALNLLPEDANSDCKFDIVLLDYQLPGLNALEICKIIRQDRKLSVSLVIVTGQGDEKIAVDALKIGVDDYIIKNENYLLRMPSVLTSAFRYRELKRQKQILIQSETKYRLLADYAADFEYWTNPDGEYEYISAVCKDTTGYPKEDFINNKNLLKEITHPDFRDIVESHIAEQNKDYHNAIEFKIITADGNEKWISHICQSVYDEDNNYLGNRGVNRDVTELKRAEQIQKILFNISNASIISDNLNELLEQIKNELAAVIDTSNFYIALYDQKTDTISLPYYTDEKDKFSSFPAGKTLTNYVIKTKKSLLVNEKLILELERSGHIERFGANSEIWLGVPLKIEGKVMGVIAVQSYTDEFAFNSSDMELLEFVSDQIGLSINRKKAEENLHTALNKATESDRLKSAFLANLSHEIRTPMNGIIGFTSLLKKPNLERDKQLHHIDIIEKSSKRLLAMIEDLLNISKIEAGQTEINLSRKNLNDFLDQIFAFFEPEANMKGLGFSMVKPLSSNKTILNIDFDKLHSILSNLIKNAIKYSNKGEIEFGYSFTESDIIENENEVDATKEKATVNLLFYVKDNGIGVPKDRQEAIFERFVQADIEDKDARQGAGLGLSIAKAYVSILGGRIWLDSEPESGSSFYFTIPIID